MFRTSIRHPRSIVRFPSHLNTRAGTGTCCCRKKPDTETYTRRHALPPCVRSLPLDQVFLISIELHRGHTQSLLRVNTSSSQCEPPLLLHLPRVHCTTSTARRAFLAHGSCQAPARIISGAYIISIPTVSSSSLVDEKNL